MDSVAVETFLTVQPGKRGAKKKAALESRSQRGKGGREDLRAGDAR